MLWVPQQVDRIKQGDSFIVPRWWWIVKYAVNEFPANLLHTGVWSTMHLQYASLCARSSNYHQLEAIQPAMNAMIPHLTHTANYAQWEMFFCFFFPVCAVTVCFPFMKNISWMTAVITWWWNFVKWWGWRTVNKTKQRCWKDRFLERFLRYLERAGRVSGGVIRNSK